MATDQKFYGATFSNTKDFINTLLLFEVSNYKLSH